MATVGQRSEPAVEALDGAQLSGGVADRALPGEGETDAVHAISFAVVVLSVFDDTTMWGATGAGSHVRRAAPSRAGLTRSSRLCLRGRNL